MYGVIMNSFLNVAKENNFVLPDYKNSNLSIIKDIANRKGSRTGKKEKKIFLLVDGLGYDLANLLAEEGGVDFLKSYSFEKISTLYPSTTGAVLPSLETGLTPSEHGMVGWYVYSKEIGTVVAPYRDIPAFSRDCRLSKAGIPSMIPQPELLFRMTKDRNVMLLFDEMINNPPGDGNSTLALKRYAIQSDMAIKLRDEVKNGKYDFIYAYYESVDHMEHKYGPRSEVAINGATLLLNEIEKVLLPALDKSDYNLVITADHGQTTVKNWIKMDSKSKIMNYLSGPPWGDARIMFLNVASGHENDITNYVAEKYSKYAILEESDNVISTGIFGKKKVDERIRYRFGTHMLIAKDHVAFNYEYPKNVPSNDVNSIGIHSGLSREEMEVPLIVV